MYNKHLIAALDFMYGFPFLIKYTVSAAMNFFGSDIITPCASGELLGRYPMFAFGDIRLSMNVANL